MEKQNNKSHLSQAFIKKQQVQLEQKLVNLIEKQKELAEFPDIGDSPDDTAQEASEFEGNLSIKKNIDRMIKQVKRALKRIEKGTYGLDPKTGEPIEQGRLEVMPEAEHAAKS